MWNDRYVDPLRGVVFDPMTALTMGLTAAGGAASAAGTIAGGKFANQAANYKAQQDEINASSSVAAAQRQSLDKTNQTRMALSTLRARGAASGVDIGTGSPVSTASAIAGRGAYHAGMALWQGQNQASGYMNQATAERASGEAAEEGSQYAALGTIANTGASMLQRYSFQRFMPLNSFGGSGMS
jgi:hypothetical protein